MRPIAIYALQCMILKKDTYLRYAEDYIQQGCTVLHVFKDKL